MIEIHRRSDPEACPPSIALGLGLERRMAEGDVVLFLDHDIEPSRSFELHRLRDAFRISDGVAPPRGVFASAQIAIIAGWASLDVLLSDADVGLGSALPPLGDLVDEPDPTEGVA